MSRLTAPRTRSRFVSTKAIDLRREAIMKDKNENRLLEALIVGLAAGAWYLVRKRPNGALRSAYPNLAGDFAL
jgi:hypothetical protein